MCSLRRVTAICARNTSACGTLPVVYSAMAPASASFKQRGLLVVKLERIGIALQSRRRSCALRPPLPARIVSNSSAATSTLSPATRARMSRFSLLGKGLLHHEHQLRLVQIPGLARAGSASRAPSASGSSRLRAVEVFICASVRRRTAARISGFDSRASATAWSTVRTTASRAGESSCRSGCPKHGHDRASATGTIKYLQFTFKLRNPGGRLPDPGCFQLA